MYGSQAFRQSKVDSIIHRFEQEGCRRLDPLTWIPCEVAATDLQQLVEPSLSAGYFQDLQVSEGVNLHCFQGQHRIAAALQWLDPNDHWWNFEIYDSAQLNDACRRRLREFDQNSQNFGDGEIFRNIRHYQRGGKAEAAKEWLAKWSPTKCREFNRIYCPKASTAAFTSLGDMLDLLLPFSVLWISWFMGTYLPSLRCPEVRKSLIWLELLNNIPIGAGGFIVGDL